MPLVRPIASALCLVSFASACVSPRGHHEPMQAPTATPGSVALGQPCRGFVDCAPATGRSVACRCADHGTLPVCVVDAEAGEPCGNAALVPCRPGLVCTHASAGAALACTPLGEVGEPCDFGGCADDLTCDGTGHCAVPVAAAGEPCFAPDPWSCRAPAVCDRATSACTPALAAGDPCDSNISGGRSQCGRGAFCTLALGERDGRCQPQKADGEPCLVDEECLSWVCFSAFCGRGYTASVLVSCGL